MQNSPDCSSVNLIGNLKGSVNIVRHHTSNKSVRRIIGTSYHFVLTAKLIYKLNRTKYLNEKKKLYYLEVLPIVLFKRIPQQYIFIITSVNQSTFNSYIKDNQRNIILYAVVKQNKDVIYIYICKLTSSFESILSSSMLVMIVGWTKQPLSSFILSPPHLIVQPCFVPCFIMFNIMDCCISLI